MDKKYIIWFLYLLILQGADSCLKKKYGCVSSNDTLTCRGYIDEYYPQFKELILCNYDNTTLYLSNVLKKVPSVENITIVLSNVTYLFGPNRDSNNIKILTINNTTLRRIPDHIFVNMKKLQYFDVRNNYIDRLPIKFNYPPKLEEIYLANNRWNCSLAMNWSINLDLSYVKDSEKMKCFGDPFAEKPVLPIAIFKQNSQINCPSYCDCSVTNVIRDLESEELHPILKANCSNRGLTNLPLFLPNYTKILHLENNSINDLTPLLKNRIYRRYVLDLFLDYNQIESIENLEGSYWLSHFRVLSLKGNRLTQLPTYALDNALQQNPNMPNAVKIQLGGNPWRCDCVFTPAFQEMLMKYEQQVDVAEVRCSMVPGDSNSLLPILSLSRTSVCRLPSEYSIRPLDLLNIVLASLIVLVLGKLAYDYYYFKRTGRLPWIVTKMP